MKDRRVSTRVCRLKTRLTLSLGLSASLATAAFLIACAEAGVDAAANDSGTDDASTSKDGSSTGDDASSSDSGAPCDWFKPFEAPTLVAELNLGDAGAYAARLTPSGRSVIFGSSQTDGGTDVYLATRASTTGPFGTALPLGLTPVNSAGATVAGDLLTIYFTNAAAGNPDIYVAKRAAPTDGFPLGTSVPSITTALAENGAYVLPDNTALYVSAARDAAGGTDTAGPITVRTFRAGITTGTVGSPVEVPLGGTAFAPVVAPDERTIYFSSDRPGTVGIADIWVAHRASASAAFEAPTNVSELNASGLNRQPSFVTADGCTLYFHSTPTGPAAATVYRAERVR